MKKAWKMKILALLVIGLFLVGAASCEIIFISHIRIVNDSPIGLGSAITQVFIVPHGSPTWGPELLNSQVLWSNDTITFEVDAGFWDVLVVDQMDFEAESDIGGVFVPEGQTVNVFYDGSEDLID